MKLLNLSQKYSGDFEGRKADENDYDLLLDEDCEVRKPDGTLLCILLKKSITRPSLATAWSALRNETFVSRNRGVASGEEREHYVKKDGTISNTHIAEPVNSGIVGFFERTPRFPYCRACAWNLDNPEKWESLLPMIQEVDGLLKKYAPDRYEKQARAAAKTHPDFLIPGTHFSTLTVNKNFRTAYHKDAGNLPDGISCMTVIRQGKWSGANLVFPAYRVAVKLDSFDTIIFDPHEIHGNTPLIKITPDAVRCSIVFYFREKMTDCRSSEEELNMVKNRKQGEQLFKTVTVKADQNVLAEKFGIRPATEADFEWIKPLFQANKKILGPFDVMYWRWSQQPPEKRSPFIVIGQHAFAHYLVKRNGERTLYEIAVADSHKRQGLGRALMEYIGQPLNLKTDADNEESNAFYRACGFIFMGEKETKSGKKVNLWQGLW